MARVIMVENGKPVRVWRGITFKRVKALLEKYSRFPCKHVADCVWQIDATPKPEKDSYHGAV